VLKTILRTALLILLYISWEFLRTFYAEQLEKNLGNTKKRVIKITGGFETNSPALQWPYKKCRCELIAVILTLINLCIIDLEYA